MPKWKTTKIEDDQNGRQPKWKTTKMENYQNERRLKWKTVKMEDDQKGRKLFFLVFTASVRSRPPGPPAVVGVLFILNACGSF